MVLFFPAVHLMVFSVLQVLQVCFAPGFSDRLTSDGTRPPLTHSQILNISPVFISQLHYTHCGAVTLSVHLYESSVLGDTHL